MTNPPAVADDGSAVFLGVRLDQVPSLYTLCHPKSRCWSRSLTSLRRLGLMRLMLKGTGESRPSRYSDPGYRLVDLAVLS